MSDEQKTVRSTREQILFGLRRCILQFDGLEVQIEENEKYVGWMRRNEIDTYMDFIWPVQEYFGIKVSDREWKALFLERNTVLEMKLRESLTFAEIADFIAERLPAVSLQPAVIFGKPCLPAGIYLALVELVRHVSPKTETFGPSTPVQERLRGRKLGEVCRHLDWVSCGAIQLSTDVLTPGSWLRRLMEASTVILACLMFCGIYLAFTLVGPDALHHLETLYGIWFLVILLTSTFWFGAFAYFRWRWSPLPAGVTTFRDLVALIENCLPGRADDRYQATECSS